MIILVLLVVSACGNKDVRDLPSVSEFALNSATDFALEEDVVKDAYIKVTEYGEITIAIQVMDGTTEEKSKELGENTARYLSTMVDGLKGPSKDYLGELYEYYDLQIIVGTNAENTIAQGAKVSTSNKITW